MSDVTHSLVNRQNHSPPAYSREGISNIQILSFIHIKCEPNFSDKPHDNRECSFKFKLSS